MKAVLPGRPEARLQALSTGYWDGRRIIVYATGNALAILSDPNTLLQTIYDDHDDDEDEDGEENGRRKKLDAVAFDEASGKIAAAAGKDVRIYQPIPIVAPAFGAGMAVDGALKVSLLLGRFTLHDTQYLDGGGRGGEMTTCNVNAHIIGRV